MASSIVLIDGEHHPPVIARAIAHLIDAGESPLKALLVGGGEKLDGKEIEVGIPLQDIRSDPERGLAQALDEEDVEVVLDLSGDPVLNNTIRGRMASITLWKGRRYRGPDFEFEPPVRPEIATVPSVAVIGSGKRSGKTAVSAAAARHFRGASLKPVIVAMGRGGPAEPEVIEEPLSLTPDKLREWAAGGRHAASDYIEGAIAASVVTVGAWRAGGGMAGAVAASNVAGAIEVASSLDPGILILEGSGAAIPPAAADATILVIDGRISPEYVRGYLGLYRVLIADLVVITMGGEPTDQARKRADRIEGIIRGAPRSTPRSVRVVLQPVPLSEVSGKRVFIVTTAAKEAEGYLSEQLTRTSGAEVMGISTALSNRTRLEEDLRAMPDVDAVVTEIKAAAIDVVARTADDRGIQLVFLDNRPHPVDGSDLSSEFASVAELAEERFDG